MPGGVVNPTNMVFAKGYLYGTISGGIADDVPFGELQDISVKDNLSLVKAHGPSALTAVGVGIKDRTLQISAKWLKIRARQWKALRGATPAFSSVTTVTNNVADEPLVFNLHLKTPSDGSDVEILIYGCISDSFNVPLSLKDWSQPDFSCEAFGSGPVLYEVKLPGDQTTS